ncbi:hypothetical protein LTR62_000844 [Meristemomyces frigidus]|uniref:Uncharacterized protein n=1 Tax=Meristemomyces frigidus TaxID=1508187 RepID=A0AAN7YIB5_9PEZI|nr:hypothetical protein LTR62_000844 [Meristemomyces frigidus]
MSEPRRPNIVVGIDIGQTCSGVAYSIGPDWGKPHTLNRWPSRDGIVKAEKVATRVGYDKHTGQLKNWGFLSTFDDPTVDVREQFKLVLDSDYEDDRGYTCGQARQWYFDYLRCLLAEIERFFDSHVPRWREMCVEYSFSTPTTWNNPAMIASIQMLVESAGFSSPPLKSVKMGLTEAEAAAIEASTTQYRAGETFVIVDAGGGTTDVNILKVQSTDQKIELVPLDHVEGISIGSTLIDFVMAQHVMKRLQPIREHLHSELCVVAEAMLADRFQILKHSFPDPIVDEFTLDVKGLGTTLTFPNAGIRDGKMIISRATLKAIFDEQLQGIFNLMDGRFQQLQRDHPMERVSYIILSGGLGSSPYLYDEMRRRYELNVGATSQNTASVRIMRVPEPQLAVVSGLVRERTQRWGTRAVLGQEVFETRRCRNSYGTIVREKYDERKHAGLPFVSDPHDGALWVEHVVDWFIKRGQVIQASTGVRRPYGATLTEVEVSRSRRAQIVMSTNSVDQLPIMSTDAGCKHVATVDYRLTANDMTLMRTRHGWKRKKTSYWKANFYFVVMLGPADLRFQIVGENGVLSSSHEALQVEFADTTDPMPATLSPRGFAARNAVIGQAPMNGRYA